MGIYTLGVGEIIERGYREMVKEIIEGKKQKEKEEGGGWNQERILMSETKKEGDGRNPRDRRN